MSDFIVNDRDKKPMNRIGFNDSNIKLYFNENDRVWHYFISVDTGIVFFGNFIMRAEVLRNSDFRGKHERNHH
jgi:hypothetical protein